MMQNHTPSNQSVEFTRQGVWVGLVAYIVLGLLIGWVFW